MNEQGRSTRRRRAVMATAVSLVVMATVAACGGGQSTAGGEAGSCAGVTGPIKIGNISPLSGTAASIGKLQNDSVAIAIDEFNKQDTICGQKIENVASDDKGDPATALGIGRKYVADGIGFMLNVGASQTQDALVPYLQKEGVVIVGNSGKAGLLDPVKNPSYFTVFPSVAAYSDAVAAQIKAQGWNDVGLLNDGTVTGNETTARMTEYLRKVGVRLVPTVSYPVTAVDLSTQIQQLKAAGAQVVVPTGATGIPALVSSLKRSGWQPKVISWGAFITFATKGADLPPGTIDGCQNYLPASQAPSDTSGLPANVLSLLNAAEEKLGKGSYNVQQSVVAYTQILVLKAAIEKAGTIDPKAVTEAMTTLKDVQGAWPGYKLSFSNDNHSGYPSGVFSFCQVDLGPYGIRYQSADVKPTSAG
jgi:branched-chain amino acid transport system substrate-binding protein